MTQGYLAIILHAHLPFVRHPEQKQNLPEHWLYEALTETYLPLLEMMQNLNEDNINYNLTLNISPPLVTMLADKLLQQKYLQHLEKMIELSNQEIERTKNQPEFNQLAQMYKRIFKKSRYIFQEKYEGNILKGFKHFQDSGNLTIITSAATHGYLPLMYTREAQYVQIKKGVDVYRQHFNQKPDGFWLPECAFTPELDPLLAQQNIRYFFSSSHAVLHADPRPRYGIFAPLYTPEGVACFGRDFESSKQVWSGNEGYPGDYDYREFYRDIGYDLDYDYLTPYLPGDNRIPLGIKYYRITGETDNKEIYDPENAQDKAAEHAGNFMFNRQQQVKYLNEILDRKPIITAPYDAELFGHWWFEGPDWLEYLFRKIDCDQDTLKTISPDDYLKEYPQNQVAMPAESSWGYKGYHEVWLNGSNDWIYRHLHEAELRMRKLAEKFTHLEDNSELNYRTLNQMGRELLLAQSSDWAFIMKTNTMPDYARLRTKRHLKNFFQLADNLQEDNLKASFLKQLENKNNIFPELDFKSFKKIDFAYIENPQTAYLSQK